MVKLNNLSLTILRLLAMTPFVFFLWNAKLVANDIKGTLRCEAVSVQLTKMEDGKAVKYSGYQNGMQVGSELFFNYTVNTNINTVRFDESSPDFDFKGFASEYFKKPLLVEGYYSTEKGRIGLGSDNIDVEFSFGGQLNLTRYYKNDWHGLYYKHSYGDTLLVAGLDCRHPRDRLDKIFSHLRSQGFRKN